MLYVLISGYLSSLYKEESISCKVFLKIIIPILKRAALEMEDTKIQEEIEWIIKQVTEIHYSARCHIY